MARRPNYAFEKRQKELQKKAKKEARRLKKLARKEAKAEQAEEAQAGGEYEAVVESDSVD